MINGLNLSGLCQLQFKIIMQFLFNRYIYDFCGLLFKIFEFTVFDVVT